MAINTNSNDGKTLALNGLAPIAQHNAKTLILGSMPSVKSLKQNEYYAHPRNGFWPIMATLFDFEPNLAYQQRCQHLLNNNIAVWDVVQHCQRQGSLDSNIKTDSIIVNNFTAFLQTHSNITRIFFNGATAENIFNKHVKPTLNQQHKTIIRQRLPSTSPAYAAMKLQDKVRHWQQQLKPE